LVYEQALFDPTGEGKAERELCLQGHVIAALGKVTSAPLFLLPLLLYLFLFILLFLFLFLHLTSFFGIFTIVM
jgi:hypothetical protein